jgi:tetratricopeptide (TPR) repeat protein/predicted Ser/Thr protein kinase
MNEQISSPSSQAIKEPPPEATNGQSEMTAGKAGSGPPLDQEKTRKPNGLPGRIGGYEVLGELGRGTFGVVYRARDTRLGREVAIKVLHAGVNAPEDLLRFRAEAEALGSLQHANIVQVFDTGVHQGTPYLVMELIEGGNLAQQMRGQPRPARDAAALVEKLARAMHVAHQKGIVHRDLKPANIMLAGDGTPKITDFGLVKRLDRSLGLSLTGQAIGTPSYMAPEQASGRVHEIGPPADVYALGAIFYELLTGRPPFCGADVLSVLDQVRAADPLSPSRLAPRLPRDLCTICLTCLEKEPRKRYASALDLADDLRRFLDGRPIVARPAGFVERTWRLVRRRPWQAALVSCGVLVVFLAATMVTMARSRQIADLKRDRDLEREQRAVAVAQVEREKEEQGRRLAEQEHGRSLEALDGILELVVIGALRNRPGLEPLHRELLRYYEKLIERQGSEPSQREKLANACLKLGKLIAKTGQSSDARAALDRAERLYQKLTEDLPDEPRIAHQLARVLLERGRLLDDMGQPADARKDFEGALARLERLSDKGPDTLDYRRGLGEALHELAILRGQEDADPQEALQLFERALQWRKQLGGKPDAPPSDLSALGRTYGALGNLLLRLNRLDEADLAYWESQRIRLRLEKTAAASDDLDEARFQLSRGYSDLAGYHARTGSPGTAGYFLEQALEIRRELVKKTPAVRAYQLDLAGACISHSELLLRLGDRSKPRWRQSALELAREAEKIYENQAKGNEKSIAVRLGLTRAVLLQARLLIDGAPDEARLLLAQVTVPIDSVLKQRPTAEALYQRAAATAMLSETVPVAEAVREGMRKQALTWLEQACKKSSAWARPYDVRQDRAFRVLRDRPELIKILANRASPEQSPPRKGDSVVSKNGKQQAGEKPSGR